MQYEMVRSTASPQPPVNENSVGDASTSKVQHFSELLNESENLVFRRFGALNARVLLHLQRDIGMAERKLRQLDAKLQQKVEGVEPRERTGEEGEDEEKERARLIDSVSAKLREYNELLTQNISMRETQIATKQQVKLLRAKVREMGGFTEDTYLDVDFDSDLIAFVPQRMSILDSLLSRAFDKFSLDARLRRLQTNSRHRLSR